MRTVACNISWSPIFVTLGVRHSLVVQGVAGSALTSRHVGWTCVSQTRSVAMCEAIKTQVHKMAGYVRAQAGLTGTEGLSDALASSIASVSQQILNLDTFELADSLELAQVLQDSDLPKFVKTPIAVAMNERLSMGRSGVSPSAKPASATASKQTMEDPVFFFTESDIELFQGRTKVTSQLASRSMHRLGLAGLIQPSEVCFGNIASAVAAVRDPDMSQDDLHDLVLALKDATPSSKDANPPYRVAPASADALKIQHPDLYAAAFSDGGPAGFTSAAYRSIRARCFVRGSARCLRDRVGNAKRVKHGANVDVNTMCSTLNNLTEKLVERFANRFVDDGTDRQLVIYDGARRNTAERPAPQVDDEGAALERTLALRTCALDIARGNRDIRPVLEAPSPAQLCDAVGEDAPLEVPDNNLKPRDVIDELEALALTRKGMQKKPSATCALKKPAASGYAGDIAMASCVKKPAMASCVKKPTLSKASASNAKCATRSPSVSQKGNFCRKKPSNFTKKAGTKLGCSRCRGQKFAFCRVGIQVSLAFGSRSFSGVRLHRRAGTLTHHKRTHCHSLFT